MTREQEVAVVVGAIALVAIVRRAMASASGAPLRDVSSFGPVEHVGATGNTTWAPPPPDAITGPEQHGGIPVSDRDWLCDCAPLNSFGMACHGKTWTSYLDVNKGILGAEHARSVRLPADKAAQLGYAPGAVVWGYDYRKRRPVECGGSTGVM